jgi:hypothetical protein
MTLLGEALGEDQDLEEWLLDSTIVRAHQPAAGAPKKRVPKPLVGRAVA